MAVRKRIVFFPPAGLNYCVIHHSRVAQRSQVRLNGRALQEAPTALEFIPRTRPKVVVLFANSTGSRNESGLHGVYKTVYHFPAKDNGS